MGGGLTALAWADSAQSERPYVEDSESETPFEPAGSVDASDSSEGAESIELVEPAGSVEPTEPAKLGESGDVDEPIQVDETEESDRATAEQALAASMSVLPLARAMAVPAATGSVCDFEVIGGIEGVDYLVEENKSYTYQERMNPGGGAGSAAKVNKVESFTMTTLTITSSATMTIRNKNEVATSKQGICIAAGVQAHLVFDGVVIENSPLPLNIVTNSTGTSSSGLPSEVRGEDVAVPTALHLVLADGSKNVLQTSSSDPRFPGLRCGEGSVLVIDDGVVNVDAKTGEPIVPKQGRIPVGTTYVSQDGNTYTVKKQGDHDRLTLLDSMTPGELTVEAKGVSPAAIGGTGTESAGDMTFNGGVISVNRPGGSGGAGIGGGAAGGGTLMTFNGGRISSVVGECGGAIGSGVRGSWAGHAFPDTISAFTLYKGGYLPSPVGDIVINGGYIYAQSQAHGNSFGIGCAGSNQGHTITINGGTLIPNTKASGFMDVGSPDGDVVITGGSVRTNQDGSMFQTSLGQGKAFGGYNPDGSIDTSNIVVMTVIDLSGYGASAKNAYVDDMTIEIDGVPLSTDYGQPTCTDEEGKLYLWLPHDSLGSEVSVEFDAISRESGKSLGVETFYIDSVSSGVTLKQYSRFDVDIKAMENAGVLAGKRYDGLPLDGASMQEAILKNGVPVKNPEGSVLDDPTCLTITQQRLDPTTLQPLKDVSIQRSASDVGKYQLILTSTQYASNSEFAKSFFGHRGYLKYAEITPADSRTAISARPQISSGGASPTGAVDVVATVWPASGEAKTCAAPTGKVQFYVDGIPWGDPVALDPVVDGAGVPVKNSEGFEYSEAVVPWDGLGDPSGRDIQARYIGLDSYDRPAGYYVNYSESQSGDIKEGNVLAVFPSAGAVASFVYRDQTVGNSILNALKAHNDNEAEAWARELGDQLGREFVGWTRDPATNYLVVPNDVLGKGTTKLYPVFGVRPTGGDGEGDGEPPVGGGRVSVGKTAQNLTRQDGTTHVGDRIVYTLTAANGMDGAWMNASARDVIPSGLALADALTVVLANGPTKLVDVKLGLNASSAPISSSYDAQTRELIVRLGDIEPGVTATITFEAVVQPEALGADDLLNVGSFVGTRDGDDPSSIDDVPVGGITDPVPVPGGTVEPKPNPGPGETDGGDPSDPGDDGNPNDLGGFDGDDIVGEPFAVGDAPLVSGDTAGSVGSADRHSAGSADDELTTRVHLAQTSDDLGLAVAVAVGGSVLSMLLALAASTLYRKRTKEARG